MVAWEQTIWRRGLALILALGLWGWAAPAIALGGPQPALNQPAPPFTLPSNAGDGTVSLEDYQGQWVVLYFYPQDFTSGCTLEAKRFKQDAEKYSARNAQILGVSTDDVASHESFCESEGLAFPLLSDPKGQVIRSYGSWLSGRALRHTYVIDPDGILRATFLGVRPAIHSQEVLATLDELQA
ncbi:MAG: peroxiredoxin [Cyanobacteria bacterium]|nr:peroxiredoxin [Cyanobacteriota bacterium]MDA0866075.1 peroxiredoxin [Cyanobacteriota bacterium]